MESRAVFQAKSIIGPNTLGATFQRLDPDGALAIDKILR